MSSLRKTAAVAVAVILLGTATASAAIPSSKARAVAGKAGAVAAKQTHAVGHKVVSCKAVSGRHSLCKVKLSYTTGAKSCIVDVDVKYKSTRSRVLVYRFGQTLCS
jgi:hypothetical protein